MSSIVNVAANKNEVYQFIAKAHMATQDTVGAMPSWRRVFGFTLRRPSTWLDDLDLSAQGRNKEAVALIDKALKVTPDNPNLLVLRGNVYFLAQEWDRAVEVYRQVLRQSPTTTMRSSTSARSTTTKPSLSWLIR